MRVTGKIDVRSRKLTHTIFCNQVVGKKKASRWKVGKMGGKVKWLDDATTTATAGANRTWGSLPVDPDTDVRSAYTTPSVNDALPPAVSGSAISYASHCMQASSSRTTQMTQFYERSGSPDYRDNRHETTQTRFFRGCIGSRAMLRRMLISTHQLARSPLQREVGDIRRCPEAASTEEPDLLLKGLLSSRPFKPGTETSLRT